MSITFKFSHYNPGLCQVLECAGRHEMQEKKDMEDEEEGEGEPVGRPGHSLLWFSRKHLSDLCYGMGVPPTDAGGADDL